jgi:DNA repair exonuclease SbcCD ATPase subunit
MTSDWKCEAAELRATPKRCPTCKQKIPADRCKAIRERIAAIESVAAKSESNTDKMAMELTLEKRKLKTLLDNMPVEPTSPDLERMSVKLNRLQSEQARTEGELSQITKRIRGLKKANAVILSQRDKLQERLATTQNKLKDLAEKLKKSRRKLSDLQAVSAAMGNGGIKSFLLEAELPAINAKATHYASRLIGPGAIVRLNATTTLKGGGERERLSVEGVIPGRTNRYASASKGQKLRMDLSLLLAFRDLCASRSVKSFNQLFADEIFDGVDKIGVERVAELLREISQACPVALVTHTDRLKQIGDRRIRVVHNGSYATVEESSVN